MSLVYAIAFGRPKARRYLAHSMTDGAVEKGWRALTWVRGVERAEKFDTAESAYAFASSNLEHGFWDVVVAPHKSVPTPDLGGTPAAVRVAG